MSIPAVNWALSQRTGSSSKKAVLKCIAEWMIGERAVDCYPTVEQIAFETELNRQTVMEATRELAKAGLITKRRVCKNLRWETHYSFVGYVPEEWIGSRRPEVRAAKQPDVQNAEGTGNRTPGKATLDGVGNRTIKGVKTNTHEGTENRTRTWIDMEDKESTRISMRTSGKTSAIAVASAQAQTPYPDDFDKSLFDEAQREAQLAGEKTTDEPPMKEEKPKRKRSSNVQKPESVSEQVWNDFTALRTKRRAPITETALKGIQREAEKAGITLEEALSTCCERGWQGFKAEWYSRATAKSSSPAPSSGGAISHCARALRRAHAQGGGNE